MAKLIYSCELFIATVAYMVFLSLFQCQHSLVTFILAE